MFFFLRKRRPPISPLFPYTPLSRSAPAAPTANLASGDHELPQTIHLGGEGIRYTTDGSDPTAASTSYAGGIHVTSDLTIKAISDRKSTRLNSSHANISYAVFCLKKK